MADRIKNYQQEADQITTLKAIRTDLGVTPSSYTPDATVVTKDRVVTFAQAEEELVVLGDIEKGVKQHFDPFFYRRHYDIRICTMLH